MELIRIPELILHPRLTVEVAFIKKEKSAVMTGGQLAPEGCQYCRSDTCGRSGAAGVFTASDYLGLLPEDLPCPFSNRDLAQWAKVSRAKAQTTYTLKKAGLLEEVGKKGNEILHAVR